MEFVFDDKRSVLNFRKNGASGNLTLSWGRKSSEISAFILIFASRRNEVIIKNNSALMEFLNANEELLTCDGVIYNSTYTVKLVGFNTVFNGGIDIPDLPGYYGVYSYNDGILYYENNPILVSVSVRLEYSMTDYFKEIRHVIRKNEYVYSGFKKITIHNGIKGVAPNSVRYRWADGRRSFALPKHVLENGGDFFVPFEEDEKVEVYSLYDGIEISRRENNN